VRAAGRKLSFSLSDLFPNLSYPVVAALDRADLDALFDAQLRHAPGQPGYVRSSSFVMCSGSRRNSSSSHRTCSGSCCAAITADNEFRPFSMSALSRCFVKTVCSRIGLWKPSFRTRKHSLRSCRSAGRCSWIRCKAEGRCRPRGRGGPVGTVAEIRINAVSAPSGMCLSLKRLLCTTG